MVETMLGRLAGITEQGCLLEREGEETKATAIFDFVLDAAAFYAALGFASGAGSLRERLMAVSRPQEKALAMMGKLLASEGDASAALRCAEMAVATNPADPRTRLSLARALSGAGRGEEARKQIEEAKRRTPGSTDAHECQFMVEAERLMPGDDYYAWLARFQEQLKPRTYVEIGLGHGKSLALAGAGTRAVGIDPAMGNYDHLYFVSPHGPATLFPLTSDDFFASHDLRAVIGQESFDLAFIDGLHIFEQVLRDFINLERYGRPDSVVLIHDCLPVAPVVAQRERCTGFWTGDVWRVIPCLKTFRPDLQVRTIPTRPSGLAVVSGLNPASTVLAEKYEQIVDYYLRLKLPDAIAERFLLLNVESG